MEPAQLRALLKDVRDQLIDDARLVASRGRRRRRRDLLARVQAVLDAGALAGLVEAARHSWVRDGQLSIHDGIFSEIDPERLAVAISDLPLFAREVFKLHCRDSLDYPSIAAQLAISEGAVRRELAAALVALDRALNIQSNYDAPPIA